MRRRLDQTDLLLVILALLQGTPRTGGALLAEAQRRLGSERLVVAGRVFVALDALEAEGLVAVDTDEARTVYRPTLAGTAALEERAAAPVLADLARDKPEAPDVAELGVLGQAAVLFTDVVASTELFDHHGAAHAHEMLKRHFALLRAIASEHEGHVVKTLGDGLMVVFTAPADAVRCALAMQRAAADSPDPLELRIGIASGEVVRDEGDYFGRPVIVAHRLCDTAGTGDVLVADATRQLVPAAAEQDARPLGELRLKGLSEPVRATALRTPTRAA